MITGMTLDDHWNYVVCSKCKMVDIDIRFLSVKDISWHCLYQALSHHAEPIIGMLIGFDEKQV